MPIPYPTTPNTWEILPTPPTPSGSAGIDAEAYAHATISDADTTKYELACDLTAMIGPFACLHDEHLDIVENQKTMAAKADRIERVLAKHFGCK